MEQKTWVFFQIDAKNSISRIVDSEAQHMCLMLSMFQDGMSEAWDGILGHQFNKSLESLTPCYSQSMLYSGFHILTKNPRNKRTRVYSWIALCSMEKWGWKIRHNLESEKTRVYAQKPGLKMPFKISISGLTWMACILLYMNHTSCFIVLYICRGSFLTVPTIFREIFSSSAWQFSSLDMPLIHS
jgi:hypothetical protein